MKKVTILLAFIFSLAFIFPIYSNEKKNISNEHEFSFYTGMFDFSDGGQKATLVGIQHQNDDLQRNEQWPERIPCNLL